MIQFENVSYEYTSNDDTAKALKTVKRAIKNVSFTVKKGEFISVLGHNGSGKSTLAKLINALLIPTEGRVTVNGYDTALEENLYKVRGAAGMVFQNPDNQIIASIVEEDVAFGPENLGLASDIIAARVKNALANVGLTELSGKPTHLLSGGQKQKLAIAGVLAMESAIIILDEPTAMLDPIGSREVLKTIKALNREKDITVILITHFMDEAILSDRVIVMQDGEIHLDNTPANVFKDPERIKTLGLTMPQIADLNIKLRALGLDLPEGVLTIKEMTDALCRLKQKI